MKKKGLDVLVKVAEGMFSTKFIVIGVLPHLLKDAQAGVPPNVEILPYVDQPELLRYYQRAKVYCQPSFTEGLPNSICEAMLCECIPVGSRVGGIPTAIAEHGFLVPYGDVVALREAINKALQASESLGKQGREYISRQFPLERRETALVRIIREAGS
jgi:glycosyltransferase involved in cell wall biosynthesis